MRIMYVEDNQVNLALVERIARMGGHQIVSFPNGEDALRALETDPCELILMDIELEGVLDGVEVVKILRERGDNRPVIAVTAYAMVGDMERIMEAGCNEYLPKPIPIAQFITLLAKYDPANVQPTLEPHDKPGPKVELGATAQPPALPTAPKVESQAAAIPTVTMPPPSSSPAQPAPSAEQPLSDFSAKKPVEDKPEVKPDPVATPPLVEPVVAKSDTVVADDTIPTKPEGEPLVVKAEVTTESVGGAKVPPTEDKVGAEAKQKEQDNDGC